MPPRPLVPSSWRRFVISVIGVATAVLIAFSVWLHDATTTAFDDWALRELFRHIGPSGRDVLIGIADPKMDIGFLALVAIFAAAVRAWPVAALAVVGPSAALVLAEVVLKPLVHRTLGHPVALADPYTGLASAFPSGHATGVASAAVVLALVLARSPLARRWRVAGWVVLALWVLAAAVGLVRDFFHFATDTIGAIALSIAVVLSIALIIDRCTGSIRARSTARQLTWRS